MADEKVVPEGEVSIETPSEGVETPQPLTEEKIRELIAEATQKAKDEGIELGKKEMQRIKDKEVAKLQRRYKSSEESFGSLKDVLGSLDPDVASQVELNLLRTQERQRAAREGEEQQYQQYQEMIGSFKNNFTQFIQGEGVATDDKRIDWGQDDEPLLTRQQKILSSIAKIRKEDSSKSDEKVKSKIEELVSRERKDAGLDSVDISTGTAAPVGMNSSQLKKKMENLGDLRKTDATGRKGIERLAESVYNDWLNGKFK